MTKIYRLGKKGQVYEQGMGRRVFVVRDWHGVKGKWMLVDKDSNVYYRGTPGQITSHIDKNIKKLKRVM